MPNHKHLSLQDRFKIEQALKDGKSFKEIGLMLDKDCTTISKEVRKYLRFIETGGWGRQFNPCSNIANCNKVALCPSSSCRTQLCRGCHQHKCYEICPDFEELICSHIGKPPYVCNDCEKRYRCRLRKAVYEAAYADHAYRAELSQTRTGIYTDAAELARIDEIVSPLIKQGQSIHHICANHAAEIMIDEKTLYNYINDGLLSVGNLDLPRKVRFRQRKKKKTVKVDKACRKGRTYADYLEFLKEHPDTSAVQIDSVEGTKGGKILLTIQFCQSQLMLAFLRDSNTAASVTEVFEHLYNTLGASVFQALFPVILTDNGSEFSNPGSIEFDSNGNRRTWLFYCDPSSPYQKGAIENNHELIRRIIPKGISFNDLNQDDVELMMNHINSYGRGKLGYRSPCQLFEFFFGKDTLIQLGIQPIDADQVILKPKLLKK
jgi:IS30 family transposase